MSASKTLFLAATLFVSQRPGALQPGTGIVTGTLRIEGNGSAEGIRVGAIATDDPAATSFLSVTETDVSGRYRLINIPAGRYYIVAGRIGHLYYYPGGMTPAEATVVEVEPARIRSDLSFVVAGNSARPAQRTMAGLSNPSDVELRAYVAILDESNPEKRLNLLQDYERKFPQSSGLSRVYSDMLSIYAKRNDTQSALKYGEKLMTVAPNDVLSLLQVSRNYTLIQVNPQKAVEYAEKAVSLTTRMKTQPPAGIGGAFSPNYVDSLAGGARVTLDWVKKTNSYYEKQHLSAGKK